jgi:hypothetical protein
MNEINNAADALDTIPEIDDEIKTPKKSYTNEFMTEIEKYYNTDKMTNELASYIVKIAEGLSYNWRFINYTNSWKEEMVGDAIIKMYSALEGKKYDISIGFNPFSYFNQIAWNAFTNRIKKENRQHDALQEYKQMVYEQTMNESDAHVYVKPTGFSSDDDDSSDCGSYCD